MRIVVTYDVNTTEAEGQKRLRKVAKICEKYGVRVQNSTFEVDVDNATFNFMKHQLKMVIEDTLDSIRFYKLGNNWENRIEKMGKNTTLDVAEPLIF